MNLVGLVAWGWGLVLTRYASRATRYAYGESPA